MTRPPIELPQNIKNIINRFEEAVRAHENTLTTSPKWQAVCDEYYEAKWKLMFLVENGDDDAQD